MYVIDRRDYVVDVMQLLAQVRAGASVRPRRQNMASAGWNGFKQRRSRACGSRWRLGLHGYRGKVLHSASALEAPAKSRRSSFRDVVGSDRRNKPSFESPPKEPLSTGYSNPSRIDRRRGERRLRASRRTHPAPRIHDVGNFQARGGTDGERAGEQGVEGGVAGGETKEIEVFTLLI